ncbi:MAG: methylornithine synthase PylB [Eubacteriaceae bacterium]|nr:methylornithine synthase PylB [Eubacteriaceae bacterium]
MGDRSLLTKKEIVQILMTEPGSETEELFQRAVRTRRNHIGNKIFVYGFVYFTTWCKNNCAFCYFRKANNIDRYRKTDDEVFAVAESLAESGVNLIDLTMGEDEDYQNENFASVISMVKKIKEETGASVMISPGVISDEEIERFAEAGADWYALYQETHNRELFSKLRLGQSYDRRIEAKRYAADKGMHIEEGILAGVGESYEDIADSILAMGELGAGQVRVMSFVPQEGSPMENVETPDRSLELKIIAAMRLAYPRALIPASLDVDGIEGLKARINAGSSVVTSIITPGSGLMGVANSVLEVDEGGRTVEEVRHILGEMGLKTATAKEYKEYIGGLK